jgi:SAM-dependent methyltransferase
VAAQDRVRWDQVYKEHSNGFPPPDPLLFEFTPPVLDEADHRALDVAAGIGQNGLWLAAQGYLVDMIDVSRVALLKAQDEMGRRQVRNVNLYQADLDIHEFVPNTYELVCVFRYLKRDLFPQLRSCVRPGGRILYETFNIRYLDSVPGFNPAFLLEIGELAGYFADWKILHNIDGKQMSSLVAIKP